MPRSRFPSTSPKPRPFAAASLCAVIGASCLFAFVVVAAPQPPKKTPAGYRVDLEVSPMAPFPFLEKFGTIQLSVFPGGVRGETMMLNAYSRNHSGELTVQNKFSRMYAEVPIREIKPILLGMSGSEGEVMPGMTEFIISPVVTNGNVRGVPAQRYRVLLGKEAWIDIWTTRAIPENPQFEKLAHEFIGTISKPVARVAERIPGMPIYVEIKTRRFNKVPILRLKQYVRNSDGQEDALDTGPMALKVPFIKALLN